MGSRAGCVNVCMRVRMNELRCLCQFLCFRVSKVGRYKGEINGNVICVMIIILTLHITYYKQIWMGI